MYDDILVEATHHHSRNLVGILHNRLKTSLNYFETSVSTESYDWFRRDPKDHWLASLGVGFLSLPTIRMKTCHPCEI
jgi:hypothetical protein